MKISPPSRATIAPAATGPSSARRLGADGALPPPAGGAALSPAGALVRELRAEAAAHGVEGDVRPGVVERMKQEIADGRLGTPEDVERAIDALLREL